MTVSEERPMSALARLQHKWSALLATAGVGVALVIAGCGGSSNSQHSAASGAPGTSSGTHTQAPAASSSTAGIPQNNGGDQDSDNNGGPSDGDGAI
jgi:hypothetical protein